MKGSKGTLTGAVILFIFSLTLPLHSGRCPIRQEITATAKKFLGISYRYGGTGNRGFDCSGFVQNVFLKHGFNLPRMSRDQYRKSRKISLARVSPGDLLFFKISRNRISHVAISLGNDTFIHSPRTGKRVRVASLKTSYWKKRFAGAGTFINCR